MHLSLNKINYFQFNGRYEMMILLFFYVMNPQSIILHINIEWKDKDGRIPRVKSLKIAA